MLIYMVNTLHGATYVQNESTAKEMELIGWVRKDPLKVIAEKIARMSGSQETPSTVESVEESAIIETREQLPKRRGRPPLNRA